MKNNNQFISWQVFTVIGIVLLFSGCYKDNNVRLTKTYTIYSPVYKSKEVVLAAINGASSEAIEHAGKIYIEGNFIYLNEVNHIRRKNYKIWK